MAFPSGGCVTLILLLFIFKFLTCHSYGLYKPNDGVVILDAGNIRQVLNTTTASFVEFYASWCGHCQRYASTWKTLAQDTAGWKNIIRVSAIDCSRNDAVCRDASIEGYPTLKFFKPYSSLLDGVVEFAHEKSDNLEKLRERMIDNLMSYSSNNTLQSNSDYKSYKLYSSLDNIITELSTLHPKPQLVAIIVEEENSYIGREVILDLTDHKNIVLFRLDPKEATKVGMSQNMGLYKVNKDKNVELIARSTKAEARKTFVNILLRLAGTTVAPNHTTPTIVKAIDGLHQATAHPSPQIQLHAHEQDIDSAVHELLFVEVASKATLAGPELSALKGVVSLLIKYYLGPQSTTNFFQGLLQFLKRSDAIAKEEYMKYLYTEQNSSSYLPRPPRGHIWVGCLGSQPKYRGYPCGVWTLFHMLSVNAYVLNGHKPDFDKLEVLNTMRPYIISFFRCTECATHFEQHTADMEQHVRFNNDSVLYFWKGHNKVNKRLKGDVTEDPLHPKIQFPVKAQCPDCHAEEDPKTKKIKWNYAKVLEFLTNFYHRNTLIKDSRSHFQVYDSGPTKSSARSLLLKRRRLNDLVVLDQKREQKAKILHSQMDAIFNANLDSDKVDRLSFFHERELETRTLRTKPVLSSWGFNSIDISMCVLFYIICSGIIVLLYFHFTVRRGMGCKQCMV